MARSPPYADRVADVTGYDQRGTVVKPLGRILLPEVAAGLGRREPIVEGDTLRIPLVHGDDVAGLLGVERPGGWCPEAIALVTALAEELQRAAVARSHPGTARRASEPETPDS